MGTSFISRKYTPHFGDKSRKLPGESRALIGGAGENYQLLSDRTVKRRLESKSLGWFEPLRIARSKIDGGCPHS